MAGVLLYCLYLYHDIKTIWLEISNITALLALVLGLTQLMSFRHNAKVRDTLSACERYDTDSVISECLRNLKRGEDSKDILTAPLSYSLDLITVLNYFEGIAIGIDQGLYDDKVAKDHLEPIVAYYVDKYISEEGSKLFNINARSEFNRLMKLDKKWRSKSAAEPTHYRA
jgi:hypothetical protein